MSLPCSGCRLPLADSESTWSWIGLGCGTTMRFHPMDELLNAGASAWHAGARLHPQWPCPRLTTASSSCCMRMCRSPPLGALATWCKARLTIVLLEWLAGARRLGSRQYLSCLSSGMAYLVHLLAYCIANAFFLASLLAAELVPVGLPSGLPSGLRVLRAFWRCLTRFALIRLLVFSPE